jgi:hypothetical protein
VLVVFHDDLLDHLLDAYGDVSEYAWAELPAFRFPDPGRSGDQCRVSTPAGVFDLHRRYAGLEQPDQPVVEPARLQDGRERPRAPVGRGSDGRKRRGRSPARWTPGGPR